MDNEKIVRALRICNRSKGHRCSECPVFSRYEHRICKATVDERAADLIEALQADRESYQQVKEALRREGYSDIETMISQYKQVMIAANEHDLDRDEEVERLEAQLEASQPENKPLTNADRIRAMSDEELAELLHEAYTSGMCDVICAQRNILHPVSTKQSRFDWLRQEVKE